MPSPLEQRVEVLEAEVSEQDRKLNAILKCLHDMATNSRCGCCTFDIQSSLAEIVQKDLDND